MQTYEIVPGEDWFEVIEISPGGQKRSHGRFVSEKAAKLWLLKHLALINMVDLGRWIRSKSP